MMYCGDQQPQQGMVLLGNTTTTRLDDLVDENVEIIKLDTEGYEGNRKRTAHHFQGSNVTLMSKRWVKDLPVNDTIDRV